VTFPEQDAISMIGGEERISVGARTEEFSDGQNSIVSVVVKGLIFMILGGSLLR